MERRRERNEWMSSTIGEHNLNLQVSFTGILRQLGTDFEFAYRLAIVPLFGGIRRFAQGRNFKQWTGNDSKALMKVSSSCVTVSSFSQNDKVIL